MSDPLKLPVVEIARLWHSLASKYENDSHANSTAGPIARSIGPGGICKDLYQTSFCLAYLARQAGINPLPLLTFARQPEADKGLLAARLVVDQLLIEPDSGNSEGVENSRPGKDELLTLDDVRHFVPGKPSYSTIYRWITQGCAGVRLESWIRGGTACTTLAAIERFSAGIAAKRILNVRTARQSHEPEPCASATNQLSESREAELQRTIESLDRAGF